ncbi:UNVERIFIED_CONTAM: hypothetical protein FKN15_075403 [Acipenser sinensis]
MGIRLLLHSSVIHSRFYYQLDQPPVCLANKLSAITHCIVRERYLRHIGRDSLSKEDRQRLKRIVEEELLKMQNSDTDSSDDEPLILKVMGPKTGGTPPGQEGILKTKRKRDAITHCIVRERYLRHIGRDSLSKEDRQRLKRIVEEELLKMQNSDTDSSDDEPLILKVMGPKTGGTPPGQEGILKTKRKRESSEEGRGGGTEKKTRLDLVNPSYVRILFAVVSLYFMPSSPLLASAFYLLSAVLDDLDGYAARLLHQETQFGDDAGHAAALWGL